MLKYKLNLYILKKIYKIYNINYLKKIVTYTVLLMHKKYYSLTHIQNTAEKFLFKIFVLSY